MASSLGWRWAFAIVGVPGSLLALLVLRLPNPARGLQEGVDPDAVDKSEDAHTTRRSAGEQLRSLWAIPSFRGLSLGVGAVGFMIGVAFWSPSFFERHYNLSTSAAGAATAFCILVGGLVGSWSGVRRSDRVRTADPSRSMIDAGRAFAVATVAFFVGFSAVLPAGAAIVLICLAVVALAFAVPGLFATAAEIVPPVDRGMAFSLAGFVNAAVSAIGPPLIGFVADRFELVPAGGGVVGNLSLALLMVLPAVAIGGMIISRSARHVAADRQVAAQSVGSLG